MSENPLNPDHESSSEERLNAVLLDYIQRTEQGVDVDREAFIAEHDEFADALREFFADQAQFDEMAAPLAPLNDSANDKSGVHLESTVVSPNRKPNDESEPIQRIRVKYFGDYELLEEIARGGMGIVYKAKQSTLKRVVALKMILAGQLAGDEDIKRFRTEAEAAARLDHPNIVPIFEIGEHEEQHYFSMAYVDGQNLARRISQGPLPIAEAVELMKKVSQAVGYAHVEGVVHRDLKPANVLIDADGEVRITDFGLAKTTSTHSSSSQDGPANALTATGQVLGTPSYMPPEQASGDHDNIGPLSDVYSLGAMLYCLLCGRPPFQAASPLDTLLQVINSDPAPLSQLNGAVPRDLETICMKCLRKDQNERYSSAVEFADDLNRYLKNEPIHARRVGVIGKIARWSKRHRRSISLSVITAVVTVAAVVGGSNWWSKRVSESLARVMLLTDGSHMVAEFLDADDQLVVDPFTIPNETSVEIPAGEYRLRVSPANQPTETFLVSLAEASQPALPVRTEDRALWPAHAMAPDTRLVPLDMGDGHNLVRLDQDGIELIDGATSESIWRHNISDFEFDKAVSDWRYAAQLTNGDGFPTLTEPAPDLNGDGAADVVLAMHNTGAMFFAFCGKTGQPIWTLRKSPLIPHNAMEYIKLHAGPAMSQSVQRSWIDVNTDGVPDCVRIVSQKHFSSRRNGEEIKVPGSRYLNAISGKTGSILWRVALGNKPANELSPWSRVYNYNMESIRAPQSVRTDTGMLIVLQDRESIHFLDSTNGRTSHSIEDLKFPVRSLKCIDLDADGADEIVYTVAIKSDDNLVQGKKQRTCEFNVVAFSPKDERELWRLSVQNLPAMLDHPSVSDLTWPLAADLDTDGLPELVMECAVAEWSEPRIRVVDGITGKVNWEIPVDFKPKRKPSKRHQYNLALGVAEIADITGDEINDLIIAEMLNRKGDREKPWLVLEARSGTNGDVIWRAIQEAPNGEDYWSIDSLRIANRLNDVSSDFLSC